MDIFAAWPIDTRFFILAVVCILSGATAPAPDALMRRLSHGMGKPIVVGENISRDGVGTVTALPNLPKHLVWAFPDEGANHLIDTVITQPYGSYPATSGLHSRMWANCGVHHAAIPEVMQVHALEHGAMIIQYNASLVATSPEQCAKRTKDVAGYCKLLDVMERIGSHMILAPAVAHMNSSLLSVSAWQHVMLLQEISSEALLDFYAAYAGPSRAPEPGISCPFTKCGQQQFDGILELRESCAGAASAAANRILASAEEAPQWEAWCSESCGSALAVAVDAMSALSSDCRRNYVQAAMPWAGVLLWAPTPQWILNQCNLAKRCPSTVEQMTPMADQIFEASKSLGCVPDDGELGTYKPWTDVVPSLQCGYRLSAAIQGVALRHGLSSEEFYSSSPAAWNFGTVLANCAADHDLHEKCLTLLREETLCPSPSPSNYIAVYIAVSSAVVVSICILAGCLLFWRNRRRCSSTVIIVSSQKDVDTTIDHAEQPAAPVNKEHAIPYDNKDVGGADQIIRGNDSNNEATKPSGPCNADEDRDCESGIPEPAGA